MSERSFGKFVVTPAGHWTDIKSTFQEQAHFLSAQEMLTFSLPWRKFKRKLISILYKNKSIQSKMYLQVIFGELMLHLTIY